MIVTIAEHSLDISLLDFAKVTRGCDVLDLGCRGFLFAVELKRLGYNIYPVDIDVLVNSPMKYYRFGIGQFDGQCAIEYSKDPQATRMIPGLGVPMFTLRGLSDHLEVKFWDLIKIDIEGSEYEVIMSLTEPPAKQLSIEFHLHTGIYGDAQVKEMEDKLLSLGYYPAKHDKYTAHGLSANYWDSLWILK